MVSFNVSQLLLLGPGAVRGFDFSEPFPDPEDELHLCGPLSGHARLTRTSEGILVRALFQTCSNLECARCLDETSVEVQGEFEEEFLPSTDVRTGLPFELTLPGQDEQPRINDHHEIVLDELLRQNILTNLPLRPLCEPNCPGLCATCGERLSASHVAHPEAAEPAVAAEPASPFAGLAVLLRNDQER